MKKEAKLEKYNFEKGVLLSCFYQRSKSLNKLFSIKASFDCNFETGICRSWYQDTTDQLNWSLGQGSTSSFGTGPQLDHTLKNGKRNLFFLSINFIESLDVLMLTNVL